MRWIFAYGSIIWRPAFQFVQVRPALLRGWRRRFWQGSPDHRGTPTNPGRVVTLVAEPNALCHGLAFDTGAAAVPGLLAALDERESGGYIRLQVDVELTDETSVNALTYFAPPDNSNFLGPASPHEMAAQIAASAGASGSNDEYVLRLAQALRELDIVDEEVEFLANLLGS